jgi:hypothetical protein
MDTAHFDLPNHFPLPGVALPDIALLRSPFRLDTWGEALHCVIPGLPEHVSLDTRTAAEGVVLVARCVCAGRVEALLDLRNLSEPEATDRLHRTIDLAMRDTPAGRVRRWARRHRDCAHRPARALLDRRVMVLAGSLWEAALEHLEYGGPSPAGLYMVLSNERTLAVEWPALDDEDEIFAANIAARAHAAFREYARSAGATMIGGVAVESSVAATPGHVHETMIVSAITPRVGEYRIAELDCVEGVVCDDRCALDIPCLRLDGLLASS